VAPSLNSAREAAFSIGLYRIKESNDTLGHHCSSCQELHTTFGRVLLHGLRDVAMNKHYGVTMYRSVAGFVRAVLSYQRVSADVALDWELEIMTNFTTESVCTTLRTVL
jgi:hypothetical protein